MSPEPDPALTREVLGHLDAQISSARRMQAIVVEQSGAIRRRASQQIVRLAGQLQAEIHRRDVIEHDRRQILARAAAKLAVPADEINIRALTTLMDAQHGEVARRQSAYLLGVLRQIKREHETNRALMQQELAFLDHLLRRVGTPGTYGNRGARNRAAKRGGFTRRPIIELEA